MPKVLIIFQTSLYLLFSMGVTASAHYCQGQQVSFELFSTEPERCSPYETKENAHDCCDDEVAQIILQDLHLTSKDNLPDLGADYERLDFTLPFSPWKTDAIGLSFAPAHSLAATQMPRGIGVPIYVKCCSLRIDGPHRIDSFFPIA